MTSEEQQEQYTLGYGKIHDYMNLRTSNVEARFFVPHIQSGMKLLDCGCGPGSITLGLAEVVSPGEVIGIDIADNQVERAKELAKHSGISNVTFQTASVYELPFPDNSFDALFANAVLEHLADPLKAISEMKRVLKSGGTIGIRDTDQGHHVWFTDDILKKYAASFQKLWIHNGGNPFIGHELKSLLVQSGFDSVQASASFDSFGTLERAKIYAEAHQANIREVSGSQLIELGLAEQSDLDLYVKALGEWGARADAFVAICFCEAVGWKP